MSQSRIEWTEATWNPTVGCTKISVGCKHCYAEAMAVRLHAMGTPGYENGFKLTVLPDRLSEPLRRKKPTVYFVNSMSDLFHKSISDNYIEQVFDVIARSPQHTFQVLTKRSDRMAQYFRNRTVPRNAWLGVTVENRKDGVPRIDKLREIDATIRFLSVEPLLEDIGEIDLTDMLPPVESA
jgi:protein gp37